MMWLGTFVALLGTFASALAAENLTYDYIVVGSGAGGGPLATRLARAGFKTLLVEAGDDQGTNVNVTVPGYQAAVTEDPKIRWDMFVNHYQDTDRAKQDPKFTYQVGSYEYHVGPNPPSGAEPLGILYPRAGTLGGCVSHNALIWITPHASDWNGIAALTGDSSWSAKNMDKYLDSIYEWQPVHATDPTILLEDFPLAQHLVGGAAVVGDSWGIVNAITGLASALLKDPNTRTDAARDSTEGFFNIPLIMDSGTRLSVRDRIASTVAAGYPLDVRTNCFVTKIDFDTSGSTPKAVGIQFLDGEHLYRASPLSGATGTPGSATASKEIIISAGAFNTVQLLKLSGIGPRDELGSFGIPVISNLPGVGTNMQDRYEIPVNVKHTANFNILDGCTFDGKTHDECLTQWENNPYILAKRGAYATNGLPAAMAVRSGAASTTDIDLFIFGGPIDFTGYFPGWSNAAVADHSHFSWYALKAHTRNHAGTVTLRSTDPLDTPIINFNYFDTGTTEGGADSLDLQAMVEAVNISRRALDEYNNYWLLGGDDFTEEQPGAEVFSDEDVGQYVKDNAWGHHASCTCPIGADDDPNAVLDSKFRVRGVRGLRVVDASVFPTIPGVFIQAPIFMISEKAADVILQGS